MTNDFRILRHFPPLVREALQGMDFTRHRAGGNTCKTGYCPLGAALYFSGYRDERGHTSDMPTETQVARGIIALGLAPEHQYQELCTEGVEFIKNYSYETEIWKEALHD